MIYTSESWQPTLVIRAGDSERTSTGVTQVLTNAGWAYCKPLGNKEGPHVLACEWVCVRLAKWFGLQTFDAAILDLENAATFPLPDHKGRKYHALPGHAFLTRSTPGRRWNGTPQQLKTLLNPGDITLLVAFDTWVLNRDRHFPDYRVRRPNYANVYFAEAGKGSYQLVAMDHTHCFNNGVLDTRLGQIEYVKDDRIYGKFPEFLDLIDITILAQAAARLGTVTREFIQPILEELPNEWQVDEKTRAAWADQIVNRAAYLAHCLPQML